MTIVAKLNRWIRERRRKNIHEGDHAPEHEGGVSSWVRHKLLAPEQTLEDEVWVWEFCLGHSGPALSVAGVAWPALPVSGRLTLFTEPSASRKS